MQSVVLGTTQWGLAYGFTNFNGRLSDRALGEVVERAWALGVRKLDTSPSYGDAQKRIRSAAPLFGVQTKVMAARGNPTHMVAALESSLAELGRESVRAVLVHDWYAVSPERRIEVARTVESLRVMGLAETVGVSVYGAAEILDALESFKQLDLVQVPLSVLDQRLVGSLLLERARDKGTVIQARSVLLQGVALASESDPTFGNHPDVVRLRATGDPIAACMSFIAVQEWVDEVVIGVADPDQIRPIVDALRSPSVDIDWSEFASTDEFLVEPRRWTKPIQGQ